MKTDKKLTVEEVARELVDGLSEYENRENFEEIITGLHIVMQDENITLEEIREQCWENSNDMFTKIYGC